ERLVELTTVDPDGVDLVPQPSRRLGGLFLLGADRFELLVALTDTIEGGLRDCTPRQRKKQRKKLQKTQHGAAGAPRIGPFGPGPHRGLRYPEHPAIATGSSFGRRSG